MPVKKVAKKPVKKVAKKPALSRSVAHVLHTLAAGGGSADLNKFSTKAVADSLRLKYVAVFGSSRPYANLRLTPAGRKAAGLKPLPKVRKSEPAEEVRPRLRRYKCEKCKRLTREDRLKCVSGESRCEECRCLWYAVAVLPLTSEERAAKEIRRNAAINGLDGLIRQVLVPRVLSQEVGKTTWIVWPNEETKENTDSDPDYALGYVTAESEGDARDYARRKWPNEFDRVVELHHAGGKPRLTGRPKFPGYLIVRMEMTFDTLELVRKSRGVLGILPLGVSEEDWVPVALDSEKEVEHLLAEQKTFKQTPRKPEPKFREGDKVRVINGDFKGVEGVVVGMSQEDDPKVIVNITVLGRTVPSKFVWWQCLKIGD